eukprot:356690-Chlamydomonas_euryale.AAC.14
MVGEGQLCLRLSHQGFAAVAPCACASVSIFGRAGAPSRADVSTMYRRRRCQLPRAMLRPSSRRRTGGRARATRMRGGKGGGAVAAARETHGTVSATRRCVSLASTYTMQRPSCPPTRFSLPFLPPPVPAPCRTAPALLNGCQR